MLITEQYVDVFLTVSSGLFKNIFWINSKILVGGDDLG